MTYEEVVDQLAKSYITRTFIYDQNVITEQWEDFKANNIRVWDAALCIAKEVFENATLGGFDMVKKVQPVANNTIDE